MFQTLGGIIFAADIIYKQVAVEDPLEYDERKERP
jgi:hypothetical protein